MRRDSDRWPLARNLRGAVISHDVQPSSVAKRGRAFCWQQVFSSGRTRPGRLAFVPGCGSVYGFSRYLRDALGGARDEVLHKRAV